MPLPFAEAHTAETIDLLAVYDATSDHCYYVPAKELGAGRSTLCLRLTPARNGQRLGTRPAEDYLNPDDGANRTEFESSAPQPDRGLV